jgi:hypothetical protein
MSIIKNYGLEAIDFQNNSLLFKELTEVLKNASTKNKKALVETEGKVEAIIKRTTNLSTDITFSSSMYVPDAATWPLMLDDGKNPLLNVQYDLSEYYATKSLSKLLNNKDGYAGLDLEKSKVSGLFSEIKVPIIFTTHLFKLLNPDEMAAVIMHEIGHTFSYLENINNIIRTNYVLKEAGKELRDAKKKKQKIKIIEAVCDDNEIAIQDVEGLARTENEEIIKVLLLNSAWMKSRSELNSDAHDQTAYEFLSDQFVSRHGGGRALLVALDKIHRKYGSIETLSYGAFLFENIVDTIGFILGSFFTVGLIFLMSFLFRGESGGTYDTLIDRLTRIRQDMVVQLKDPNLSKGLRVRIDSDLKAMDSRIKLLNKNEFFIDKFFKIIVPSKGREAEQLAFQKDLEGLLNNDLYVKANSFKV